jgi:hypothetical protein
MTVRPFDWRDIPRLHRYRKQSVFLDTALVLTRGPMLLSGAMFSYLAPSMGVFTYVCSGHEQTAQPVIGQFLHLPGAQYAHLTFLAPDQTLAQPNAQALLDYLVALSGERGAMRLLADVDEASLVFEALRRCGFGIYTRQRIWQIRRPARSGVGKGQGEKEIALAWRTATSQDAFSIRVLYNDVVPGLVQQVEPFISQQPHGLVRHENDELIAYVEIKTGLRGIWVQPFIHPDAQDVTARLIDLIDEIPNRPSRPVYVCVRSYQSWLENALEELGAEASSRQAVMVKHLAAPQKAERSFALPALEGGRPDVSIPLAHIERH